MNEFIEQIDFCDGYFVICTAYQVHVLIVVYDLRIQWMVFPKKLDKWKNEIQVLFINTNTIIYLTRRNMQSYSIHQANFANCPSVIYEFKQIHAIASALTFHKNWRISKCCLFCKQQMPNSITSYKNTKRSCISCFLFVCIVFQQATFTFRILSMTIIHFYLSQWQ